MNSEVWNKAGNTGKWIVFIPIHFLFTHPPLNHLIPSFFFGTICGNRVGYFQFFSFLFYQVTFQKGCLQPVHIGIAA